MGKVKVRKRRLRRLSLKWSFFLYAAVAVLAALAAIMLLTAICSELQSGLYHRWERAMGSSTASPRSSSSMARWWGSRWGLFDLAVRTRARGRIRPATPFTAGSRCFPTRSSPVLSILTAGVLFYRRKLKRPLRKIEEAAGRIARNDLDFTIPALEKGNEMDRGACRHGKDALRARRLPAATSGARSNSGGRCRPPFPTTCARR